MDSKISEFLNKNNVGALTVQLPDGTLHSAAMHYSHIEEPFTLYFSTDNTTRKCQGLLSGDSAKCGIVIGLSEAEWVTLQLSGEIKLLSDSAEVLKAQGLHYSKHPHSAKYKDEPGSVILAFTPTWWRYTDSNSDPKTVLTSEG